MGSDKREDSFVSDDPGLLSFSLSETRNRLSSYFLDYPPATGLSVFPSSGDDTIYMYRNHHQLGFVRGKSHEPEKIKLPPLDSSGEKIRRTRRAGGERRIRCRGSRVGFQTPDGDECKKPSVGGHESTGSRFGERTRVPGVFVATNYRFGVRDRLRPPGTPTRRSLGGVRTRRRTSKDPREVIIVSRSRPTGTVNAVAPAR